MVFPPAFIDEVNRRNEGVVAEFVKLGGTRMDEPCTLLGHHGSYLAGGTLLPTLSQICGPSGCDSRQQPFHVDNGRQVFEATLATKLGIAHPKTVVLPNKEYVPGIVHDESLRNLVYPLDWQGIIDYVGMPWC